MSARHKFILFAIFVHKNVHNWWKFDKVLTKIILHSFLRHDVDEHSRVCVNLYDTNMVGLLLCQYHHVYHIVLSVCLSVCLSLSTVKYTTQRNKRWVEENQMSLATTIINCYIFLSAD